MDISEIQKRFNLYTNMHRALVDVLVELPLPPELIKRLSHDLDTCFLWVEKALQILVAQQKAGAGLPEVKVEGVEDVKEAKEDKKAKDKLPSGE